MQNLTPQDFLQIIENHGGPEGLDLSNHDFTGINLDYTLIQDLKMNKTGVPGWYSAASKGINLKGIFLKNSNLSLAKLRQANLTEASLYGAKLNGAKLHDAILQDCSLVDVDAVLADLSYCNLTGSYLNRANLVRADLSNTKLHSADLSTANLTYAKMENARLFDVDLRNSRLEMVNFYGAIISNSYFTRNQIGKQILQETIEFGHVKNRFIQAASVYSAIKNNFLSIGNYEDASWAYIHQRQNQRKSHSLTNIRGCYQSDYEKFPKNGLLRLWALIKFYTGHFLKYFADWFFEISCQYGESPFRTIYFSIFLIIIFSLLYSLVDVSNFNSYFISLNHSIKAFISITNIEKPIPIVQIITTIQGLFGLLMISLLMFSVGNRIKHS